MSLPTRRSSELPGLPKKLVVFFFNDTATTEIYTLSLHDALPICGDSPVGGLEAVHAAEGSGYTNRAARVGTLRYRGRSEEHTSELQSRQYIVCRLLLEKKKPRATSRNDRKSTRLNSSHATISYAV